ncbi:FAD-binding protein [Paracoccus sp. WLY502]|uniref:FAD-binding protein n=1 Tax=Paracoccus yibinensis TaxID=3068891 RepID=UPI0027964D2F|nr:FAD-binding protein [Paracoccus sp. WLY502]MDQ1899189.1 FAD-binding protein [Paracoccus sp. WLY502]
MTRTVAILGAGPVGLAAAAHVLERGMRPLILEQGAEVGHSVRAWGHVPMFSNWRSSIRAAAARRLEHARWQAPDPEAYPTGAELVEDYLQPLGQTLAPWLRFERHIVAVSREGIDKVNNAGHGTTPFMIDTEGATGEARNGADAVTDATGTWFQPNPGGAGRPVPGELGHLRFGYGMPDVTGQEQARRGGKRVAVLGGGHSAMGTLIALSNLSGTSPIWLCRASTTTRARGGGAADRLAARGVLGTGMARSVDGGGIRLEKRVSSCRRLRDHPADGRIGWRGHRGG